MILCGKHAHRSLCRPYDDLLSTCSLCIIVTEKWVDLCKIRSNRKLHFCSYTHTKQCQYNFNTFLIKLSPIDSSTFTLFKWKQIHAMLQCTNKILWSMYSINSQHSQCVLLHLQYLQDIVGACCWSKSWCSVDLNGSTHTVGFFAGLAVTL